MSKTDKKTTRGRRPTTPAKKTGPDFVGETPAEDARREVALRKEMQQVLEKYGDGVPYVREACELRIRQNMGRAIESIIAIGRDLLVMRAHEAHGEWLPCLRRIGMEPRYAQRMMAAATRISGLPSGGTAQKLLLSSGAPGKLFDMLALSDEELDKIGAGGTDIDPDDIENMAVSELRRQLRELRDDHETTSTKLGEVRQKNDKLKDAVDAEKARWRRLKPDEQLQKLELAVTAAAGQVRADLSSLAEVMLELLQVGDGEAGAGHCGRVLAELLIDLQRVRDNEALPVRIPVVTITASDG